ncbi:MAG: F0F1 ATP synthase subunit B [Deltaproteobacteria bacterium]
MIFLADFSVIRPDPGLFLWAVVIFLVFWFVIGKYAFKPIANALKEREASIQNSLDQAKLAQEKMEQLKAENEVLIQEARVEKAKILAEAKEMHTKILNEAKEQAKAEASKIVERAKTDIENEKEAAFADLKNQIGSMALVIAEQILEKNLSSDSEQVEYADKLLKNLNLN